MTTSTTNVLSTTTTVPPETTSVTDLDDHEGYAKVTTYKVKLEWAPIFALVVAFIMTCLTFGAIW